MGDLVHFFDRDSEPPANRPCLILRQVQGQWIIVAAPLAGPEKVVARFYRWSPAATSIDALARAFGWSWVAEGGPPDG